MNTDADKRAVARAHLEVVVAEKILKDAQRQRADAEHQAHYRGTPAYTVILDTKAVTVTPPARDAGPTARSEYVVTPTVAAENEARSA